MKISQKIFILSFILIIITMDIVGYVIIKNNHKINLEREIQRIQEENETIIGMLKNYVQPESMNTIEELIIGINNLTNNNDLFVEICLNSSIIYSNMIYEPLTLDVEDNVMGSYIEDIDGRSILFTTLKTGIQYSDYKTIQNNIENFFTTNVTEGRINNYIIYTSRDVTDIFIAREIQIKTFVQISIILTFILSLFLAVSIYFITRKINKIEDKVIKVSKGDYTIDFNYKGQDEIASLNNCFQIMIESINKNIDEIERISENRQNFINDITHEIRSPLTSIIGFSELLANVKISDEETIQKYSLKIYEEGKYIEKLTESLIQIVLLENKNIKLEEKNVSLIICGVLENLDNTIENIVIKSEIEPNVIKKIEESLIKSLLTNLVKNASKAYEKNGIVQVILTNDKLIVRDFGKGIPEDEIQRILEPFYTMDKARNRKESGMGLGLPLCKKIAEIHGFIFEIKSRVNKGTTIIIKLVEGEQSSNVNKEK